MIPKEKAIELIRKISYEIRYEESEDGFFTNIIQAKKCALIAVDEILKITWVDKTLSVEDYWKEVKKEIEEIELI